MPNRRLSAAELEIANLLLTDIRSSIETHAKGDPELLFALRRKVAKELTYDERSKPMIRRALKTKMRKLQNGLCPICTDPLPERYCVLDRTNAVDGYVVSNVRLLCPACDQQVQTSRRFT